MSMNPQSIQKSYTAAFNAISFISLFVKFLGILPKHNLQGVKL